MKGIIRFFWFCSGAHVQTLKKYPIEHNKYVGIGATIFFTALFATLSGGYAMYFVFSGDAYAVAFAVLFGLIWGLAIFNMDRYIVASIDKQGSGTRQFFQALPRILLAIMIGVVISRPLELKIFDKEIKQKLKVTYLKAQHRRIDTVQKTYTQKYGLELAKNTDLKKEKDSLEKDINRSRYQLNQEIFGDKTNQTSGKVGFGTFAKQKQAVLTAKEARLNSVREEILKTEVYLGARKDYEGLNNIRLYNDHQLDSLANVAGFADRNHALGQLAYDDSGVFADDTYWAETFISLLFILFECLPVFVKLMSPMGPYDIAIAKNGEADIHYAQRSKERNIEVTDNLFRHHVENDIERHKDIISKQPVDYETERHRFD